MMRVVTGGESADPEATSCLLLQCCPWTWRATKATKHLVSSLHQISNSSTAGLTYTSEIFSLRFSVIHWPRC